MPDVATCIIVNQNDKILILHRSNKVKTYKGLWGGVAGYVESNENPLDTAFKEIKEEVNIEKKDIRLEKICEPVKFTDIEENKKHDWRVHPFIFRLLKKSKIQIDWEHSEYRWIKPENISQFRTVPRFENIIKNYF